MSALGEERNIGDLLGGLSQDVTTLFRKEVQLAKAETKESVGKALHGIVHVLVGAVLALGALGVLLTAAVAGLSAVFIGMGMDPASANALSAVVVGAVVALIAYGFVRNGINALKADNLWLDRTAHSVARDANVIKEKVNG